MGSQQRQGRGPPSRLGGLVLVALLGAPACGEGGGEGPPPLGPQPQVARHEVSRRDESARHLRRVAEHRWAVPMPASDQPRYASEEAPDGAVPQLAEESYYVHAPVDPLGQHMGVVRPLPRGMTDGAGFEQRPIPPILHRVYFPGMGDDALARALDEAWTAYGRDNGLQVRLWGEESDDELAAMMPAANFALMCRYRREGPAIGASHLARYSIVERFGGIFVDAWIRPPQRQGGGQGSLPIGALLPPHGLVVMSAWEPHVVGPGYTGLTLSEKLFASPPGSAALSALVDLVAWNHLAFVEGAGRVLPTYTTGRAFFDRVVQQVTAGFTMLPASTLASVGMLDRGSEGGPETLGLRGHETVGRLGGLTALMNAPTPGLAELAGAGPENFFDQPVPRRVHQIWLGELARLRRTNHGRPWAQVQAWRSWSRRRSWQHRLWTDADLPELERWGGADLAARMRAYRRVGDPRGAADVARYIILHHEGGLYADVDISAPGTDGCPDDLDATYPLRGLLVAGEAGYNFGNIAMYPANNLLLSSPGHPLLGHALAQLPANDDSWRRSGRGHDPVYVSGPGFLSRMLAGPLTVVQMRTWKGYGVSAPPGDDIDGDDPRAHNQWPRNLAVGE